VVALVFEASVILADCITVACEAESSDVSADDASSATEIVDMKNSEDHILVENKPTTEIPRSEKVCDVKQNHKWGMKVPGLARQQNYIVLPFEVTLNRVSWNLKQGVWSCFLVSQSTTAKPRVRERFIMVVEWDSEDTAICIGGVFIESDLETEDEFAPFWSSLGSWSVRLL
jgi:hypothetical protein